MRQVNFVPFQKHNGQGLGGAALENTILLTRPCMSWKKNCGGIVYRQKEANTDCWIACNQASGPCAACDKGGFAGKCCRKGSNWAENGCDGIEGGNGHICVADDPGWNFAGHFVYELREGDQPQTLYSGQHACWPRVCIHYTSSHPRAAEDCENRWFGNDFFTFVKGSSRTPGVVYLSQGYNPRTLRAMSTMRFHT